MQLLLCSIVKQNIQILYWVPVIFVVTHFWMAVVKNGHGLLDHGTLKSAVSQESELIKWTDFFACWYKFRKANVNLIIIGWAWSKMGSYKVWIVWDSKTRCISHIVWLIKEIDWPPIYSVYLTLAGCPLQLYLIRMFCSSATGT